MARLLVQGDQEPHPVMLEYIRVRISHEPTTPTSMHTRGDTRTPPPHTYHKRVLVDGVWGASTHSYGMISYPWTLTRSPIHSALTKQQQQHQHCWEGPSQQSGSGFLTTLSLCFAHKSIFTYRPFLFFFPLLPHPIKTPARQKILLLPSTSLPVPLPSSLSHLSPPLLLLLSSFPSPFLLSLPSLSPPASPLIC